MRKCRAVLLCGQERSLLPAIARALARADASLFVQAAPAEVAARQRLCTFGSAATVVVGALGGEATSRQLVTAAWKAAGAIDAVVICPTIGSAAGASAPSLDEWQVGLAAGLRAPFFLARQVGLRLRRPGGRLLFAIGGVPHGAGPLPRVIRSALLPMVEALARSLGPTVAVAAVVGGEQSAAVEIARGVCLLLAGEPPPSGTILELGGPSRRG
jgi:NAD(P)-dependent dehydrogenase (short-subunit alcohol dehydrogenase family)